MNERTVFSHAVLMMVRTKTAAQYAVTAWDCHPRTFSEGLSRHEFKKNGGYENIYFFDCVILYIWVAVLKCCEALWLLPLLLLTECPVLKQEVNYIVPLFFLKVSGKGLVRSQRLCVQDPTGLTKLSQHLCGYSDAWCCPGWSESVSLKHTTKWRIFILRLQQYTHH